MDKLDILVWAIGGGFAGTWALIFYGLKCIGDVRTEIKLEIDGLRKDVQDVDRRICRLEGSVTTCCAIRHEHHDKAQ